MSRCVELLKRLFMPEHPTPEGGLARVQREYAGSWVALKGGRVVEVRRTPYELVAALHERDITDTTVVRIPSEDEPELVGLG
jgi:hypothetical protein